MNDEIPEGDAPRDLLGDPIDQNRESWGRPKFKKTKENQELVTALSAAGWTQARIARQVGCDVKTLRHYFSLELTEAPDKAEAMAILSIHRRARDGNVTAANRVIAMAEKGRAVPPPPKPDPVPGAEAEAEDGKPQKQGKKEMLAEAAASPGGRWGQLLQ